MTRTPHDWFGDVASAGAVVAAFDHAIPTLAALVGLVWYLLMIYESHTVQRLFHKKEGEHE